MIGRMHNCVQFCCGLIAVLLLGGLVVHLILQFVSLQLSLSLYSFCSCQLLAGMNEKRSKFKCETKAGE